MNTNLLETTSTTREHERSSESHNLARRSGPLDRLAMRAGLALLVWSRRTLRRMDAEQVMLQQHLTQELRREQENADSMRSQLAPR